MNLNVRSLRSMNRRTILETLVECQGFDVLTLTETWWNDKFTNAMLQFHDYQLAVRCDREFKNKKSKGGGVAIYVKNHIKFHSPISRNVNNYGQLAAIKIKDAQIAVVYRKPANNKKFDKRFKAVVMSALKSDNVVITGDTNLPGVKWDENIFPSRPSKLWRDLCIEMSLEQLVHDPTHIKGNQLDCVFARSSNSMIVSLPVIDRHLFHRFTDHFCVIFDIKIVMPQVVKKRQIFDEKRMDWQKYEAKVDGAYMIPKVDRAVNGGDKWKVIHDTLSIARESACPKITINGGSAPKWINHDLQKYMRKVQRLRKATQGQGSSKTRRNRIRKWKFHQKNLEKKILQSRVCFEKRRLEEGKNNPKVIFNAMKKAKRPANISPPINDSANKPLVTDVDKANEFQTRFIKVFTEDVGGTIVWENNWGLNEVIFTPAKVKKAIQGLKNNTAPGSDGLGPALFKNGCVSLPFALADLYNHTMETRDFPGDFLTSKVIPLWKQKGDISDADKYRCVTLGQTGLKIGERVVLTEIDEHFDRHNLNDPWQHGFQKGKSTITNLVDTWDFLSSQVDQGKGWVSLSVDFSSAFDKISIYHLLLALQKRGIGGKLGAWIETWLRNRSQFVQVGEERSRIEKCSSGTPQGSQSGPRFFCTVLSDVFQDLTHIGAEIDLKMSCYADDTRILFQCRNQAESLIVQEVVNTMHQKIKAAGLQVNASKSILVYYGRGNYITPLFIDGQEVPVCNQSLELGCIFSKSMSFTPQLERNIQKANNFVFLVRNTLKVRNRESLKTLYQVYYLPILTYGIQVWFNPQAQTKKSLYKAYKNFWRLGNGGNYSTRRHIRPIPNGVEIVIDFSLPNENWRK